jgi:hypothetical protein
MIAIQYIFRLSFFVLTCMILFAGCEKGDRLVTAQSGVWEITKVEQIDMLDDKIISTKTYTNAGHLLLYNNGSSSYINDCVYNFDIAYKSEFIKRIANQATELNPQSDKCNWESGPTTGNRITLVATPVRNGGLNVVYSVTLTINSKSANKQEWTYIINTESNKGSRYFKEVLFVERKDG